MLENIKYNNNDHPQNVHINISHEIFLASFHSTHTLIPQWGGIVELADALTLDYWIKN